MTDHAAALHAAERTATPIEPFTGDAALGLDAAYGVQQHLVDLRLAEGEQATGLKLGFTARAKMRQMGVEAVIAGQITTAMAAEDGGEITGALIHPRIEPELVFLLGADVVGADVTDGLWPHALSTAVAAVAVGLEVIDSRYRDFRFTVGDVVADNASAARYAVGPWHAPGPDLGNLGVVLEIDGRVAETGSTAAILGDPRRALTAAVAHARAHGIPLRAGQVILAGAATAAHPFPAGTTARAQISRLGSVTLRHPGGDR